MASDVYPASHTDPLTVASGATSAPESITERFGLDTEGTGLETMWIRVVMLGSGCTPPGETPGDPCPDGGMPGSPCADPVIIDPATATEPVVCLKAGSGTAKKICKTPKITVIEDGSSDVANAFIQSEGNGVYLVTVILLSTGNSWEISIKNNDAVPRDFVWVVADNDDDAHQPWLHATETLTYDTLVGQTGVLVPETVQIQNKGTGDLQLNDVLTPDDLPLDLGSGFSLNGYADLGGTPVDPPITIAPNGCIYLDIDFTAPSSPGETEVTFDVESNDALAMTASGTTHNRRVALTANTARLEVALLLDSSGSMRREPGGSVTSVFKDQRWGFLFESVGEFFNLLVDFGTDFGESVGAFGVAVFNDNNAETIERAEKIPFTNSGKISDVLDALEARNPSGGTPMGEGIEHVLGPIANVSDFYEMDEDSVEFNQRWMVLMSDGAHNEGKHPEDFYGGGNSFDSKKVRAFTIAYGELEAWEVDHALLGEIATESGGEAQVPDAYGPDLANSLKKAFRDTLIEGLSLQPVFDPEGLLTPSAPEARYPIWITRHDKKASFVVNWETFDAERVTVQLVTSLCEVITRGEALQDPNISFHQGPRGTIFGFNEAFLQNAADPSQPREGLWTLIVSLNTDDASERFAYDVVVDSSLRLDLEFERAQYYAGDTIEMAAKLTVNGVPIPDASVTLKVTRPGQSVSNQLAYSMVTEEEYSQAQETLGVDTHFYGVKAFALEQKGVVLNPLVLDNTITMAEQDGKGIYEATVSNTSTVGPYLLHVTAMGQTAQGVTFHREQRLSLYLDVRPAPDFTLVDILYGTILDQDLLDAEVRVTLRDELGNVLLVDPSTNPQVALTAEGGEFVGPLQANLDGTYSRTLRYAAGTSPAVSLDVRGERVVPRQPIAPVTRLHYAERILDFELGGEAEKGINQHRDPRAALGNIATKPADTFVSLGASGSLTVGVEEEQAILPSADQDDVTVFIQADTERRSYIVEASPVGSQKWVRLGTSAGTTQGFNLSDANLKAASAIRVTDTSGRLFDSGFNPSPTPGVSVRGVGFQRVGEPPKGCLAMLLQFLGRLWRTVRKLIQPDRRRRQ